MLIYKYKILIKVLTTSHLFVIVYNQTISVAYLTDNILLGLRSSIGC